MNQPWVWQFVLKNSSFAMKAKHDAVLSCVILFVVGIPLVLIVVLISVCVILIVIVTCLVFLEIWDINSLQPTNK